MEAEKRKSVRLMSSLMDLKLVGSGKPNEGLPLESKLLMGRLRTHKKILTIKGPIEDTTIYESFSRVDKLLTSADERLIRECLASHFIFSSIIRDTAITQELLKSFFCCQVKQGNYIIKQGDNASSFFVLQKGRLDVIINGESKREIRPQEGFGELALLYNAPRSASLRAKEDCCLWGIDRTAFKKAVTQAAQKQYDENKQFVEKFKFFQCLSGKQREGIAEQLILHKYEKGDKVVHEGDPADSFYIVKSGKLRMLEGRKQIGQLNAGDYFGENALLSDCGLRRWTVEAEGQCYLLALGRETLTQLLGKNLQTVVIRNKILAILRASQIFSVLSSVQLERLTDLLKIEKLSEGGTIVKSGDHCREKLFFILEGAPVSESSNTDHSTDFRNTFFGEKSMLNEHSKLNYTSTIRFEHCGTIAHTTYTQVTQALGGSYEQILNRQKNAKTKHKENKDTGATFKQQTEQLSLDKLFSAKSLGHGQFGRVYLVTNETRSCEYALKCIEKCMILESRLEKHLQNEKLVLEQINHPFLIQYGRSFKDANYIYFLTEHINGMEMFDVIRDIGLLKSRDTCLYIAQMLQALDYLHRNNIIYRDLKPENIMVDKEGYLKLIDMGTCKIMSTKATLPKTFTIIGTPHYMGPEVLSGKGYTYHADLWSLGVCMYEFMVGYVPFGEDAEDPYEIYSEIIKKDIEFPNYINDDKAKALMRQLLSKIPETRLGGSFAALYNNPWFSSIQWDLLLAKKLKMPYLIPLNKLTNTKTLFSNKRLPRIQDELSTSVPRKTTRKDYLPDWDRCF